MNSSCSIMPQVHIIISAVPLKNSVKYTRLSRRRKPERNANRKKEKVNCVRFSIFRFVYRIWQFKIHWYTHFIVTIDCILTIYVFTFSSGCWNTGMNRMKKRTRDYLWLFFLLLYLPIVDCFPHQRRGEKPCWLGLLFSNSQFFSQFTSSYLSICQPFLFLWFVHAVQHFNEKFMRKIFSRRHGWLKKAHSFFLFFFGSVLFHPFYKYICIYPGVTSRVARNSL